MVKNKVGIWHSYEPNFLKKHRRLKALTKQDKKKFIKNLNKIGYCFSVKKKPFFIKTIKAFQRRFRPQLVDGKIDQECLKISKNVI